MGYNIAGLSVKKRLKSNKNGVKASKNTEKAVNPPFLIVKNCKKRIKPWFSGENTCEMHIM